jgi:hypothetical protein
VVEQLLLRGVAAGASTVDVLAEALELPQRLVLDAAIDLLARSLVETTPEGTLEVHATVAAAMGDPSLPKRDWFLGFQSAEIPDPQPIPLLQDLVAGEVFLARKLPPIDRVRLPVMPENSDVPDIDEIPRGVLLAAVTHAMRARADARPKDDLREVVPRLPRNARVLQVHLRRSGPAGGPASHVAVRRAMLLAHIEGESRGDHAPPRINVLGPGAVPRWVRRSIAFALDGLWMRGYGRGQDQFFDRVARRFSLPANPEAEAVHSPDQTIAKLDDLLSAQGDPAQRHDALLIACDEARPAVEHLASHVADAEVIAGPAALFREEALRALREAQQQVVLACPWIRQLGRAEDFQDALRGALQRGVNVVLVWGIDDSRLEASDPTTTFLTATEQDARGWPGAFVLASRGAHSHAKVIARDLDWVLVSSANFLNSDPAKQDREVGVRLSLASDDSVSLPAQSVLSWVRRMIPDYLVQERCVEAPLLLGRVERRVAFALGTPIMRPQMDLGEVGVAAWSAAWQGRRNELGEAAVLGRSAVVPVYDAQHRDLFVRAAATAKRRFGVASHRVTTHGLSDQVVGCLLAALLNKVEVRLSYDSTSILEAEPEAEARVMRVAEAGALTGSLPSHAKFLVCDDWAIVSSYNFLSADPGLRSAHELGLQVFDEALVQLLWDLLSP